MSKSVLLANVRLSYVHLETPARFEQNQGFVEDLEKGQFSALLLIPKGSEAEKLLTAAIEEMKSEALAQGIRDNGTKKIVKLTPKDMLRYNDGLKDGDAKDAEEYHSNVYINAKTGAKFKPVVYDKDNKRVGNETLYSGVYANVYVNVVNYSTAGNLGATYQLVALQWAADGEPLAKFNVDTDSIFGDKKVDNTNMAGMLD